jgi:hypothetical protein
MDFTWLGRGAAMGGPAGDEAVCGGSWCGYTWSAVARPVGCIAKFSKTRLVEKWTFNSLATALLNSPAVSMTITCSRKSLWRCVVWQNCTFWSGHLFPPNKVHLHNDHAVLSASWYAVPLSWMDYLGKRYTLFKSVHSSLYSGVFVYKWINMRITLPLMVFPTRTLPTHIQRLASFKTTAVCGSIYRKLHSDCSIPSTLLQCHRVQWNSARV